MQEVDREIEETSEPLDSDIEEDDDVFFRDVSEDLDDEERTSYAVLLILAVGGFALSALLLNITLTSAITLKEYMGEIGWGYCTGADAPVWLGVDLAIRGNVAPTPSAPRR